MSYRIKVNLKHSPYTITIAKGISKIIPAYIKRTDMGNFSVIITTKKVYSLYRKHIQRMFIKIPNTIIRLPDTEKSKSKTWLFHILKEMAKEDNIRRRMFVCCIGGGVTGDVGALSASLYKRGIPYIQVPTTLLAQVDSSIGGKTAIDLFGIKNIIGTFYHPKAVFIDTLFLETLPKKELKQGISEAIKYGIIKDKNIFISMQKNYNKIFNLDNDYMEKIVYKCASIKARIISIDEKEDKGIRTLLNFGHTTAHALEAALKFTKISHGEAVALGMIQAAYLSKYMNLCSPEDVGNIKSIIKLYGLPLKTSFNIKSLMNYLEHDKKFTKGKIRMVLISEIGKALVKNNIPKRIIKESMQHIAT